MKTQQPEQEPRAGRSIRSARTLTLLCLALVTLTVAVYWPVGRFEFVNFDDTDYVNANAVVQRGLTWEGVKWAFTTGHASNWHPVTWLSHQLDCQLFGVKSGAHHLTNLLLHLANTLLLFGILERMTGAVWRSAFVAALFALHPLHVESVAWISERKDVLSSFFLLLTLFAYLGLVRKWSPWRYALVVGLYALGLMAKPMLVTLPFALLLLDYWPLRRVSSFGSPVPGLEPRDSQPATAACRIRRVHYGWWSVRKFPCSCSRRRHAWSPGLLRRAGAPFTLQPSFHSACG